MPTEIDIVAVHDAIRRHLGHGAAALADPGTEMLADNIAAGAVLPFPPAHHDPEAATMPIIADTRNLPPALKPVQPAPPPIALPDRATQDTEHQQRSRATQQRWARLQRLADEHYARGVEAGNRLGQEDGFARGERAGYRNGWRWGLACGVIACVVSLLVGRVLWQAAEAAPQRPAAAQPRPL